MRSNYKKLGQFIKDVSVKNKALEVKLLLGVSITKRFIPSIANIVGTDMSTYKIVKQHQFAYGPVTSRNGEKISVALLENEECIVSTSYTVFEIVDTEQLDPEYLMMWFRRSEFDRYARFMSHGTVRELFGWEEMCDVELPVPSIEKQREIVREYNVVNDRISLNEQLTQKLEDTAQAIYKQWFVDFEFPISKEYAQSIGKPELEGKPYKSSAGEMEYCDKSMMEIPKGWKVETYEECFSFKTGKLNSNVAVVDGEYPFFTCSAETYKTNTFAFDGQAVLLAGNNASAIYPLKYYEGKFDAYQRTYVITPKSKNVSLLQIYFAIKSELEGFKGTSSGTATKFLTMTIINPLNTVVAPKGVCEVVNNQLNTILKHLLVLPKELELLNELNPILLAKISKG
ncbi:restriction endonuclease subunit S [Shewanella sp. SG41-4]|uniref:restriction endonuclease subunit S n=1 Tax=Shewanella sp. SG41-4 TaxID=2760976 RepID=UPI001602AEF6|nr:restriction endonuclease subunit S [Shewanella sp. SG41-4]MBB1440809.1 restriction endonuclease subunit S [Shewanella sp. SG41-4]